MKFFTKIAVVLLVTFSFQHINAQEEDENLSLDSGTIDSQFEYILKKSGNFRGTNGQMYEAVKRNDIIKIKANTIDSLKTTYAKLNSSEKTVEQQRNEIENLKTQLQNTQSNLATTNEEKDSMSLFGMQMGKASYNVLLWSIIGILSAMLLFFIYKYKNSNTLTRDAKFKLEEVESEFEDHRRTALEREQKVRRQLQDEINKSKS
ncbi:tRNA (guanine-N1)-methyltransferase [Winogradskyella ursingii]|uniref:tRNA (guanine-N1)-methyltransferase n=1 Tax=Winogradskyella ursingii TaxID=2686079 RepID=UPI0015CC8D3B|nr:tRNA (guanine-N1)-methyltransferase [Winogradskyella ursingii]